MPTLTELWVRDAPAPTVVQLAFSEEHPALVAARGDLDCDVWDHLAATRADDGAVMEALAGRPLDTDRLVQVLTRKGQRAGVILAALRHNAAAVTEEMVEAIPKVTAKVAKELVALEHLGRDLRVRMAAAAGGVMLAHTIWEWTTPEVTDPRALELLVDADAWWPKNPSAKANFLASSLFELAPGVATALCAEPELIGDRIVMTVAGSHQLTAPAAAALAPRIAAMSGERAMYTQMAFAANPRVPLEVAEEATTHPMAADTFRYRRDRRGSRHLEVSPAATDDVDLLKWVVSRSLPTDRKPNGRPWCTPDIVASPAFSEIGDHNVERVTALATGEGVPEAFAAHCAARLGVTLEPRDAAASPWNDDTDEDPVADVDLAEVQTFSLQSMCPSRRRAVLRTAALRLGDDQTTWRTFLELVDGFSGSLDEAIDLAVACA